LTGSASTRTFRTVGTRDTGSGRGLPPAQSQPAKPNRQTAAPPENIVLDRYHMAITSNMRKPLNIYHAQTRRADRPPKRRHGFVRGSVLRHIARKD